MSKNQMMQRRYFLITIFLAILVLTSGCKNTENQMKEHKNIAVDDVQMNEKDEKKEVVQKEEVLNKKDEEIGGILLEDIIESCLDDYSYNKIEKEEWTIYECEANEESMYDGEAIIKIRQEPTIECFDYKDIKQYMREQFDYNKLCHCKYEENKYGITEIYYSWNENDDKWNLVFCGSTAYTVFIEGEFYLHTKLFSYRWDEPIVEEYSEKKIKNANGEISIVTTEIVHTEKKAVYGFDFEDQQEKGYSVEVTIEDINYRLVLIDEQKEIQSISWEMGGYDEYPQFLDVNTDGFLDLLLPTLEGELYLFDNERRRFDKIEYSGYWGIIEVKENQIWNWCKKGGEGYILEVLQLDGNKVVVISREEVMPEQRDEQNILSLEEAEEFIKQADEAVHDIMKALQNGERINDKRMYDSLQKYFDDSIIDYVLYVYQILSENGEYTYEPYAEYKLFWLDTSKEMTLLSQNNDCSEIGVVFCHTWKIEQEQETVSIKIEWKDNKWKITDMSQWYNDFCYYHIKNASFEPEYFTKEQAEKIVENYGIDEAGNYISLVAGTDADGYVLKDSSTQLLSEQDINGLSGFEMYIAVQEIYARHGKKFNDPVLYNHFNGQHWYKPYNKVFLREELSEIENFNIKILAEKGDFTKEVAPYYGSMYDETDSNNIQISEEEVACAIYEAFAMSNEIIVCKEEYRIEEKSQDVIQYYSLGEYSDESNFRTYLSNWYSEEAIDYLILMYNTWTGLNRDENGKFYVSKEGTYGGESYKPYFGEKMKIKEEREDTIVVETAFYNYNIPNVSSAEMVLVQSEGKWIIQSIFHPYYDELYKKIKESN